MSKEISLNSNAILSKLKLCKIKHSLSQMTKALRITVTVKGPKGLIQLLSYPGQFFMILYATRYSLTRVNIRITFYLS